MGMFDDVIVSQNNELGISSGSYQTKDFNNKIDRYDINHEGYLTVIKDDHYHNVKVTGSINIYREDKDYYIYFIKGKAEKLIELDEYCVTNNLVYD